MLLSRFKFNLCLNHPIITNSFDRETIFSYFCTLSKERHRIALSHIDFLSFMCIVKKFSIILDYLVSTFSQNAIKLDFNEKPFNEKSLFCMHRVLLII